MRINSKRNFSEPYAPYRNLNGKITRATLIEPDHVPSNKRRGEFADARLQVDFTNCIPNDNNGGWLEISLTETITPRTKDGEAGRVYCRSVSVTLTPDDKAKLIALLQSE